MEKLKRFVLTSGNVEMPDGRWMDWNVHTPFYLAADVDRLALDEGCSMAARTDLGHGKNGHCAIRNQPCPPLCLKKQIANLETEIRSAKLLALRWSKEKPKEAGQCWWYRRLPDIEPRVYEIHQVYGSGQLVTHNGWEVDRLSEDGGEWAGPLVLPEEPLPLPLEGGGG